MPGNKGKFKCFQCGCCCKAARFSSELADYIGRDGQCRYFSPSDNTCQIYTDRPAACSIEKSWEAVSDKVSWDDFAYTAMLQCVYLRYVNGIPEPEGSPFAGKQEQIAEKIEADLLAANQGAGQER